MLQEWPLCVDLTCRPRCTRCCCQLSTVGLFLCCHFWTYTHTQTYTHTHTNTYVMAMIMMCHTNNKRQRRLSDIAALFMYEYVCAPSAVPCVFGVIRSQLIRRLTGLIQSELRTSAFPAKHSMGALGQTRTNDRLAILFQLCG